MLFLMLLCLVNATQRPWTNASHTGYPFDFNIGDRVQLHSLKTYACLNGMFGTVVRKWSTEDKYDVDIDSGETKAVKTSNLNPLNAIQYGSASASSSQAIEVFNIGQRVKLHSLKTENLNGLCGKVTAKHPEQNRYEVQLDDGRKKSIKASNLDSNVSTCSSQEITKAPTISDRNLLILRENEKRKFEIAIMTRKQERQANPNTANVVDLDELDSETLKKSVKECGDLTKKIGADKDALSQELELEERKRRVLVKICLLNQTIKHHELEYAEIQKNIAEGREARRPPPPIIQQPPPAPIVHMTAKPETPSCSLM